MNFTPSQLEAIHSDSLEILVCAGAGAGKTRVMVERIVRLIVAGASPSAFLVLTFTRKAAQEMVDRLSLRIEQETGRTARSLLQPMMIGTFHSIALRILMQDGDRLGYRPESMTVVTETDADLLLKQVARDLGYLNVRDGRTVWRQTSWKKVSDFQSRIYSGQADSTDETAPEQLIFNEYSVRLFEMNALDFGSILKQARRLLQEYADVLQKYHRTIRHVVVDELQDTDLVQFDLHDFFSPPATFFAVGDFKQTLYKWRGARPDLFLERHSDAHIVHLSDCFRCATNIVEAANRLISHNGAEGEVPMVSRTGEDGQVSVVAGDADSIPGIIQSLRDDLYGWNDICVMARTHTVLKEIEVACTAMSVPVFRVGSTFELCETDAFRYLHAAMRLCVNPRDDLAFLVLLPVWGLTDSDYSHVRAGASRSERSHWQEFWHRHHGHILAKWFSIAELIHRRGVRPGIEEYHIFEAEIASDLVSLVDAFSEWSDELDFMPSFKFWCEQCAALTFAEALRWFAVRDSQDDVRQGDFVTLITVHAAKGLEWPAVIIAHANEGTLPSSRSLKEENGVADERRVAYVGYTRPMTRLILNYAKTETRGQMSGPARPMSRFVPEAMVSAR